MRATRSSVPKLYDAQGADELVFLDITASSDDRATMVDVVARTAEQCFMPLTVGGGIRTVEDFRAMLLAGADKVSVNTAAIRNRRLVSEAAENFGSPVRRGRHRRQTRCSRASGGFTRTVVENPTGPRRRRLGARGDAGSGRARSCSLAWMPMAPAEATTSSLPLRLARQWKFRDCRAEARASSSHLAEVLARGNADAVLAASIFHFGAYSIAQAKEFLARRGIAVRL